MCEAPLGTNGDVFVGSVEAEDTGVILSEGWGGVRVLCGQGNGM